MATIHSVERFLYFVYLFLRMSRPVCATLFEKKSGTAGAGRLCGPRKESFWGRRRRKKK